ncbi:predicted protein [Uncinocarpus reesii 1704]|uniref:Transcription factor IIIC subunit 5 HTH domain-containing protein n=1 Tax=Uncinocarpus reesii (strain UAMH 1704) TaxID=336963 RepID=C4JM97_UNCRE|nr:uncharacterized protein UREG_03955 [Uncinocarpus reesii 1704]EEP79109.1 predicted protein [Uncinocarpus reesii 1704]
MASWKGSTTAPWYTIPPREIVDVEHPCVVKDVDRAIASLQRGPGIAEILDPSRLNASATLTLNPADGMSRPLFSTSKPANNMLLKVTVPKRTGRKRKRRSQEPYRDDAASRPTDSPPAAGSCDAKQLLRRLRDNADCYDIEVVGKVERVHVFRNEKLKNFELDMSKGVTTNVDIVPPPSFSHVEMPFKYNYRQNPSVKQAINLSGETMMINTNRIAKVFTHLVPSDVESVPTQPSERLPPIDTLDEVLRKTIDILQGLFNDRPAWTRRGIRNHLITNEQKYALRSAVPYVGYIFRSGPWRDAIVRFGYDPRTTPESRIYQTLMFRIPPSADAADIDPSLQDQMLATSNTTPLSGRRYTLPRFSQVLGDATVGNTSHLFTGHPPIAHDGKTWMICDIRDPIVTRCLSPYHPDAPPPQPTCEPFSSGWYGNVTLATARAIMRAKIQHMLEHKASYPDDDDFLPLFTLPAHAESEEDIARLVLSPSEAGAKCWQMMSEIRGTLKTAPGRRPVKHKGDEKGLGADEGRRKRVRWEDEEEGEDEGEEGEEAEEARQLEEEAEREGDEEDEGDGEAGEDEDDAGEDD